MLTMEWTDLIALLLLASIVVANIVATVAIVRSPVYARAQKQAQLYLVWLLPVIGAGTVLHFTAGDRARDASESADSARGSGESHGPHGSG